MPDSFDVFPSVFENAHQSTILIKTRPFESFDLHSDQIGSSRRQIAHSW